MKVKPQFVASGVGANWLPAARALAMAALLALAATASEQTNGTWTGADGATWDTSAVNWSGFTFYQLRLARHGQGLLSRLPLPWRGSLCLARPLLAAPFGPSVMCFLRTSQCFGWPDPNFKHGRNLMDKTGLLDTRTATSTICERRFAAEAWDAKGLAVPTRGSRGRRCATSGKQ